MKRKIWALGLIMAFLVGGVCVFPAVADDMRIGMIGLDTSHVVAFAGLLNDPNNADRIPGARITVAVKAGSDDLEVSYSRRDKFAQELQGKYGVKIIDSIDELCTQVDAVMIESVDGRVHLEQAKQVFKAGKPVFIDKPVAASLRDAIEIFRLAKENKAPCFSSSSYRFYPSLVELKGKDMGEVRGAISYGPCTYQQSHPDLFWYGVHSTEALFTIMGTGCESVVRTATPDTDVVTGVWSGGRVGTMWGLREQASGHRVIAFGKKSIEMQGDQEGYAYLLKEIIKFFQTGVAPVSAEETIEIFAFMEGAQLSKEQGGVPVKIADLIKENSMAKP